MRSSAYTRTVIQFNRDYRDFIWRVGSKRIAHTFKRGQKVKVDFSPPEVPTKTKSVDLELASGGMVYCVPINAISFVAGIRPSFLR